MDGLNRAFTTNTIRFLQTYAMDISPSRILNNDPLYFVSGPQFFDILPFEYPSACAVKFYPPAQRGEHTFDTITAETGGKLSGLNGLMGSVPQVIGHIWKPAPKVMKENEAPFKAYWLTYEANATHEMDLGQAHDYFFTAGLSGCSVVVSGNPQAPHVAHVNRADNAELVRKFDKFMPNRAQYGVPEPTKSETTTRELMLQELQAAVKARQAGVNPKLTGTNFPKREGDPWAVGRVIEFGGPQQGGPWIFGVCDYALHYAGTTPLQALACVVGKRNTTTLNWHFYMQRLDARNGDMRVNRGAPQIFRRGPLQCMVCKHEPTACTCTP
jgi:hypothetical protein